MDGDYITSLILALIPPFGMILGVITRFKRRQFVFGALSIFLNPLFYIADILSLITKKRLDWLAYDTEDIKLFKKKGAAEPAAEPVVEK